MLIEYQFQYKLTLYPSIHVPFGQIISNLRFGKRKVFNKQSHSFIYQTHNALSSSLKIGISFIQYFRTDLLTHFRRSESNAQHTSHIIPFVHTSLQHLSLDRVIHAQLQILRRPHLPFTSLPFSTAITIHRGIFSAIITSNTSIHFTTNRTRPVSKSPRCTSTTPHCDSPTNRYAGMLKTRSPSRLCSLAMLAGNTLAGKSTTLHTTYSICRFSRTRSSNGTVCSTGNARSRSRMRSPRGNGSPVSALRSRQRWSR